MSRPAQLIRMLETEVQRLKAENQRLVDECIRFGLEIAIREEEDRFKRALLPPSLSKAKATSARDDKRFLSHVAGRWPPLNRDTWTGPTPSVQSRPSMAPPVACGLQRAARP